MHLDQIADHPPHDRPAATFRATMRSRRYSAWIDLSPSPLAGKKKVAVYSAHLFSSTLLEALMNIGAHARAIEERWHIVRRLRSPVRTLRKISQAATHFYTQRIKGFEPPGDEPLLDPEGAERFRYELARARRYLEFGSGGTTVLAARSGVPTVSVESDPFYARAVARSLPSDCVRQVVVDLGLTGPWGTPYFHDPEKGRRYASAPFDEGPFPDLILVDGRYRAACALNASRQAWRAGTQSTLMFDDYARRSYYHLVERVLGSPEMAGRVAVFRIGIRPVTEQSVEAELWDKR